ncbi:MAG TPA: hypothetical protein VGH54_16765 [Mycobacterium sp.]|jgi:hypothetical protein|uniref:hypothetical protein n=1 Tax=Mycobacterium sp. TaxID=1785 RepID=UPI002F42D47D
MPWFRLLAGSVALAILAAVYMRFSLGWFIFVAVWYLICALIGEYIRRHPQKFGA